MNHEDNDYKPGTPGSYLPSNKDARAPCDWELLAKRLMGAMSIGLAIEEYAGHRWIIENREADHLPVVFRQDFPSKVYGGFDNALNRIDEILKEAGEPVLIDQFNAMQESHHLDMVFGFDGPTGSD